ncbi:MAG TPA: hypothetical protein VJX74_08360 [Blastocatellia bacterium]|nr:hypothetical protein [Blastocatellia bacterium]
MMLVIDDKPLSKSAQSSLLTLARMDDYLSLTEGQEQASLLWAVECRQSNKPCITLQKQPRWYQLSVHCFGDVMTDETRNQVFEILIAASLPGAMVRVSNRTANATRLPFASSVQIARCLVTMIFDERNREPGAAREHVRWQAEKRADGEIKYQQRGQDKRSSRKAA